MKILFLSLLDFKSLKESNIYTDLLREFKKRGHKIYVVSPVERKKSRENKKIVESGCVILKPVIGNIQKTGYIEKGISTVTLERILLKSIKSVWGKEKFDLVLYTTPPVNFQRIISYIKRRDKAVCYLMLKDIFPQNAVDIQALTTRGWKGIIYKYFKRKERRLYEVSDYIGCMSKANVRYLLEHNYYLQEAKVGVCPNAVEPKDLSIESDERVLIRKKYGLPEERLILIYGGNLGKPQGIDFLIQCLVMEKNNSRIFFCIVGNGTEYEKINQAIEREKINNVKLMRALPKEEYDKLLGSGDVGMIFLDKRFTIPNFPSRLLSYLQGKMPVLAVTDVNTDIGQVILEGEFGWWCESGKLEGFHETLDRILKEKEYITEKGENSWNYLLEHYTVDIAYKNIMAAIGGKGINES